MKALKITNVQYFDYHLANETSRVKEFAEYLNVSGLPFYSLMNYFANTIQRGGDLVEFWVVANDEYPYEPYAFAHWMVCGAPHVGKVAMDYVYSWGEGRQGNEATRLLLIELYNFVTKHKAPFVKAQTLNYKTFRALRQRARQFNYDVIRHEYIDFELIKKGDTNGQRRRRDRHDDSEDTGAGSDVVALVADNERDENGRAEPGAMEQPEHPGISTDGSDV